MSDPLYLSFRESPKTIFNRRDIKFGIDRISHHISFDWDVLFCAQIQNSINENTSLHQTDIQPFTLNHEHTYYHSEKKRN